MLKGCPFLFVDLPRMILSILSKIFVLWSAVKLHRAALWSGLYLTVEEEGG